MNTLTYNVKGGCKGLCSLDYSRWEIRHEKAFPRNHLTDDTHVSYKTDVIKVTQPKYSRISRCKQKTRASKQTRIIQENISALSCRSVSLLQRVMVKNQTKR